MKGTIYRIGAVAVGLLVLGVLPAMAGGMGEGPTGTRVEPSAAIVAFFEARGVEGKYLSMDQSQVPEEQWRRIVTVINSTDTRSVDDESAFTNDSDHLYSLVMDALFGATENLGESAYMSIGGRVWTHTLSADQLVRAAATEEGESA